MKKQLQNSILAVIVVFMVFGCHYRHTVTEDIRTVYKTTEETPGVEAANPITHSPTHSVTQPSNQSTNQADVLDYRLVTATDPVVITAGDVTLLIDSGAVSRNVGISVVATTEEQSGEIPSHLENLTASRAVYRMLPDGQKFNKDITIAMRYDSTALPYGYTSDDIYTFFYNEEAHMWQQVERDSVDTRNQIVYSRTDHFTDYINGVLKVPENSDAMAYTPTSIKDLKAADPLEGVTLIAPPEANNMGTANLSYPLTLPAGRHGMQPQLAVTYNSAGGSGILGLGWSLPVSEICVDTRRGVPLFDDTLETETYTLDGEVLVTSYTENGHLRLNKPAYMTPWKHRIQGKKRFYPRVEGNFRRIERIGTGPKNYSWVVTDKNGTRYYYGEDGHFCLKDNNGNIVKWCLNRVADPYGNEMHYSYTTKKYHIPYGASESRQILLSAINYTASKQTGESGMYNVIFIYSDQSKRDSVTSARYGFLEADAALLDRIDVLYNKETIKHYVFGYKQGAYGKTLLCNIIEADSNVYNSECIDCTGETNEGNDNLRTPDYVFCGDSAYIKNHQHQDNLHSYFPFDTVRFFNYCNNDTDDFYSDSRIYNRVVNTPPFSRDVYDRCTEMDTTCWHNAYIEHQFRYTDMPPVMFSPKEYITNGDNNPDQVRGPLFLIKGNPGPLDGSGTKSWNLGGAIDVGFGYQTYIKTATLGGSYNYSKSQSDGLVSLIDLNGDGFSDKIYKRNDSIIYRLRSNANPSIFLEENVINDFDNFLHSTNTGNTWGIEGSVSLSDSGASFGLNWSDGNSTTTTFFSDMNGDGLPDIVSDGHVYYNNIQNGIVYFEQTNDDSLVVITSHCGHGDTTYVGEPVDMRLFDDYVDSSITICDTVLIPCSTCNIFDCGKHKPEYDTICHFYTYSQPRPYVPDLENVRFWQAPHAGAVRITDTARMSFSSQTDADGVRIIVQFRDSIISIDTLLPGLDTSFLDDTLWNIEKEDRIYFRVLSMDSRSADRLMWDPTITYLDENYDEYHAPLDSLGIDSNRFSYSHDFLLSGLQKIQMPFKAEVYIEVVTLDTMNHNPENSTECHVLVNDTVVVCDTVDSNPTPIIKTDTLNKEDKIQVRLVANQPVNWCDIEVQCRIRITQNLATDEDSLFACVDTLSSDEDTIYFFDYYPQIQKLVYSGDTLYESVHMAPGYDVARYSKFGTMYRNWGQFAYKAPAYSHSEILKKSLLNTNDIEKINFTGDTTYYNMDSTAEFIVRSDSQESTATIGGKPAYNPMASTFFIMQPDFKRGCWSAYSEYAYIERHLLSNLPHPANGMTIEQADSVDYESSMPVSFPGAVVVNKKSFNKSFGISGGVNASVGGIINWSGGGSYTTSQSRQLSDMMDLNGDGMPDVMSEISVQYSRPFGGLGKKMASIYTGNIYPEHSHDTVIGGSFGGSAVHMLWQLENSNRKSTKSITGNAGANIGGTIGYGRSTSTWADINGDGLPDKIYCEGNDLYYYQNIGYGFLPRVRFSSGNVRHSSNLGISGGANIGSAFAHEKFKSKLNVSINVGLGVSGSLNTNDILTMDINGDGLPDRLIKTDTVFEVQFNTGNGFDGGIALLHLTNRYENTSITTDLTGAVTVGVTFGFIPLKIEGNPKGGLSRSLSGTRAQWADMNADGVPDYVWAHSDDTIAVVYSYLGTANMLEEVTLPTGGSYLMTYKTNNDGPESNMRHRVMSSLTITDNRMQTPDQHRHFEYYNRHYDRVERDDYGYAEVITVEDSTATDTNYRRTLRRFHNQHYLVRGLCYDTKVIDGHTGDTLSGEQHTYRMLELPTGDLINASDQGCYSDGYPAVVESRALHYDNNQPQIISRLRFGYTSYGNIDTVYDDGALGYPDDDYIATTRYDSVGDYIVSAVKEEKVFYGDTIYRLRSAIRNDTTGDIRTMTFHYNGEEAVYDFHYDIYGNIDSITFPENYQGQRFYIVYRYDDTLHALPVKTRNAYGLTSSCNYDYLWQKPVKTRSVNGARTGYQYDSQGRLKVLYAPFEISSGTPTIRYEYFDRYPQPHTYWDTCKFWARTLNLNEGAQYIGTVTISDGLGRPRVVKKDAAVNDRLVRVVSGWTEFDGLGRKVREYYPDIEDTSSADSVFFAPLSTPHSQFSYDPLDRIIRTVYPDSTYSTTDYSIDYDADNVFRMKVSATDQNGHTSHTFTNVRELNTTVIDPLGATTVFHYDHIGQLTETIDPEVNITIYTYDNLGRRSMRKHPSAGTTTWKYDAAGNMLSQSFNSGEYIDYEYEYTRPVHITYSNRPWNDVWYEYGDATSGTQAGRLLKQQDATGVQEFEYDEMGNVITNVHTYVQPQSPNLFTLTTQWQYDSWGRILNITYPDQEVVDYHYDEGGLLYSIEGYKPGIEGHNTYIKHIHYDRFGQRIHMLNGNSVETTYEYDSLTRRLSHLMDFSNTPGEVLQDNYYFYDAVGNIDSIVDHGRNERKQIYEYDDANRLTYSGGNMREYATNQHVVYKTTFDYSPAGRLLDKSVNSSRLSTALGLHTVDYDNTYKYYAPDNPYAVSTIMGRNGVDYDFEWDRNGNLVYSHYHPLHTERRLCWTEDNRLQGYYEISLSGGKIAAWYNYSADGERNFKLTSPRLDIHQNGIGFGFGMYPPLVQPTLYASPLVTLTQHGYTKHYFEEGRRICSKIGGGFPPPNWQQAQSPLPTITDNYESLFSAQLESVRSTFGECLEVNVELLDENNLHRVLLCEHQRDESEPAFYYHSDHLGSAAYLTDEGGQVTQTLNYLPYGEDWVELNTFHPDDTTRLGIYRFNGKEKDWESGFHYYGARYYWSEVLTGWLSVDPMMDKAHEISPYSYCRWNPIKLIDPDGEWPWDPKHIRQARKFAHKNDGTLNIWTERDGVKLASVAYAEKTHSCEVSVSITLFQPEGYNPRGEIKQSSGLTNVEMWMDSPAENITDALAKEATCIAYGVPNDLSKLFTGKTIAGSDVTPVEREAAFAGTAASFLSPLLKVTGAITSTKAKKGLQGFNEFVKKNPGIIQRQSRKGAGDSFKRNQIQQEGLTDFNLTIGGVQIGKEAQNVVDK